MITTYKEVEQGFIQRTDVDGEVTTSYAPINSDNIDKWQEALDAGAIMLTDAEKDAQVITFTNERLDAAIERIESRAINALINFALDPSPTKRQRLQNLQDKIEEKLALKV